MPIDFDSDDLDAVTEEIQQAYEEQESLPTDEDVDEQMSEVEKRLEMAQYYRLLLNESLFENPSSPEVAIRVETEIRDFVRSRMSVLVGVGSEPQKAKQLMTEDEAKLLREIANPEVVRVIKELASKLLKKPSIMEFRPKPMEEPKLQPKVVQEPTLRKAKTRPLQASVPPDPRSLKKALPQGSITISGDQQPPKPIKGQRQKKVYREIVTEDGKIIKQDVTPPAQPIGVAPLPTPRTKEQISLAMATAGATHGQVAMATLGRKLNGDIEGN